MPIETVALQRSKSVNPQIKNSMNFVEWEAMVFCGATLTEILEWERGKFPVWFKAKVLAFMDLSKHKQMHIQDAATPRKK